MIRIPRKWRRRLRALPPALKLALALAALLGLWAAANAITQVARKPTELFFPVSGVLAKTPAETWEEYEPIFREHATAAITPELLAALAQVEAAGNPVARTYWRWRATIDPFELYRPASSAVGMYQITDGTFEQAKRYCIHDNLVAEDGPWHALRSCWFNSLYLRVVPSHAAEMTSAFLNRKVADILERAHIASATATQQQDLAAVIHLCGASTGDAFARRGFIPAPNQRCGAHDLRGYLAKVNAMKRLFE